METTKKITKAHTDIRRLIEVDHYEDHEKRTESEEYKRTRKKLHESGTGCWIGNGRCEGGLEIHHDDLEYSALSEVDIEKVKAKYPNFKGVDDISNMQVLCRKHHREPIFGKHYTSEPIWKLQAFMTESALDHFELDGYTEIYYEKFLKEGKTIPEAKTLASLYAKKKVDSFKGTDKK